MRPGSVKPADLAVFFVSLAVIVALIVWALS